MIKNHCIPSMASNHDCPTYLIIIKMLSSMRLSPATIMGKEESKKIKTIIQSILDKPESYDFQIPVDWKCT
jgi:hypothetical protein